MMNALFLLILLFNKCFIALQADGHVKGNPTAISHKIAISPGAEINGDPTGEAFVEMFFRCLKNRDYPSAFTMTENYLWYDFDEFLEYVVPEIGEFYKVEVHLSIDRDGLPGIIVIAHLFTTQDKYKAKDAKSISLILLPDEEKQWKIYDIATVNDEHKVLPLARDSDEAFESIALAGMMEEYLAHHEYSDPVELLEDYYAMFDTKMNVRYVIRKFYPDTVMFHHDKEVISIDEAVNRDLKLFNDWDVEVFDIEVHSKESLTEEQDGFIVVQAPVTFNMYKRNGEGLAYKTKIIAAISEYWEIIAIKGNPDPARK